MLTRLYVDNFRCLENFEYCPDRRQLIFGDNGAGKSSMFDAFLILRQIAIAGTPLDDFRMQAQRTRWLDRPKQTIELEVMIAEDSYVYRIVLEPHGDPPRTRIASESVKVNGGTLFHFEDGDVHLYNDQFEAKVSYPFDQFRSALATVPPGKDNVRLARFREWLSNVFCFRINPFAITGRAENEHLYPNVQLDNLAAWYRHLVQVDQRQNFQLIESLRRALDGFQFLPLQPVGENVRLLLAEFHSSGKTALFGFQELSEGQRCLICLYIILHFLLSRGCTVLIDEPDNFISLREIQPWLTAATDAVEENGSQLILISHHPEIIDQWAPAHGVQFVREEGGPVRVKRFEVVGKDGVLAPSELVARGWIG